MSRCFFAMSAAELRARPEEDLPPSAFGVDPAADATAFLRAGGFDWRLGGFALELAPRFALFALAPAVFERVVLRPRALAALRVVFFALAFATPVTDLDLECDLPPEGQSRPFPPKGRKSDDPPSGGLVERYLGSVGLRAERTSVVPE